ncbi:MAG: acyl-CoA synthetase [Hellea sp.]|nr:acyl-CoA synthetase [Hellea sp.]
MANPYNIDLDQNPANFQPLTPLTFLDRAASVFPKHTAIVHGKLKYNYREFYDRSRQIASALSKNNIVSGDTVSVLLTNTPAMLECHYGIPMTGAVIHSINTRLDAKTIAFQLDHANAKVFIFDSEFKVLAEKALNLSKKKPLIIAYNDPEYSHETKAKNFQDYEEFLKKGDPNFKWLMPSDEWNAISINYTSGTTGNPKGVVSHHRGAYLLAQGNALTTSMQKHSNYLWTLPMFHCNGWCFPWTMSAIIGTHICLRDVKSGPIWKALYDHKVTHLCGAPIVMSLIINAPENEKYNLKNKVQFFTAAAPPPAKVLEAMHKEKFDVTHLYGLTETYGPAVVNDWHSEWDNLSLEKQAILKSRQGVRYLPLEDLKVLDPDNMEPVPHDGKTIGEVMFRGNVVMKGYFKNKKATLEAFRGGWFHSGDLGVTYPDGYIQLKDRSKDIIISGGENISSIEIEEVLYTHPSVSIAAVVAMKHKKWGETPCAFIEIKSGKKLDEDEIIKWCRQSLASYKVPKKIIFKTIPRTSTGKIQKYILRDLIR